MLQVLLARWKRAVHCYLLRLGGLRAWEARLRAGKSIGLRVMKLASGSARPLEARGPLLFAHAWKLRSLGGPAASREEHRPEGYEACFRFCSPAGSAWSIVICSGLEDSEPRLLAGKIIGQRVMRFASGSARPLEARGPLLFAQASNARSLEAPAAIRAALIPAAEPGVP